jgi:hypothetical protein
MTTLSRIRDQRRQADHDHIVEIISRYNIDRRDIEKCANTLTDYMSRRIEEERHESRHLQAYPRIAQINDLNNQLNQREQP